METKVLFKFNKYEWVANLNPTSTEHQSVAKLRKRAEAFAHFWYQFQYSQEAVGVSLLFGGYSGFGGVFGLRKNSTDKKIRFERPGLLSLNTNLSQYLENSSTSNTELEYVLDIFLNFIKTNYETEKTKYNY